MFRSVISRNLRVGASRIGYLRGFTVSYPRQFFGGGGKNNNEPPSDPQEVFEKFATTLKNNPELGKLLDGFQKLLVSKGIDSQGKPPSMTQMMKMLTDADIRQHLSKLKDELDRANIQINQKDLSALTDIYLSQQKK